MQCVLLSQYEDALYRGKTQRPASANIKGNSSPSPPFSSIIAPIFHEVAALNSVRQKNVFLMRPMLSTVMGIYQKQREITLLLVGFAHNEATYNSQTGLHYLYVHYKVVEIQAEYS